MESISWTAPELEEYGK
jgi:hypothetical protein